MGFSQVAAAAILLTAAGGAAFAVSARSFEATERVHAAWADAVDHDLERLRSSMEILQVVDVGASYEVQVRNTGSVVLDVSEVELLAGGVPVAITDARIDGATTDVWPPLATLVLTAAGDTKPTDVAVASGTGVLAFWRE